MIGKVITGFSTLTLNLTVRTTDYNTVPDNTLVTLNFKKVKKSGLFKSMQIGASTLGKHK